MWLSSGWSVPECRTTIFLTYITIIQKTKNNVKARFQKLCPADRNALTLFSVFRIMAKTLLYHTSPKRYREYIHGFQSRSQQAREGFTALFLLHGGRMCSA